MKINQIKVYSGPSLLADCPVILLYVDSMARSADRPVQVFFSEIRDMLDVAGLGSQWLDSKLEQIEPAWPSMQIASHLIGIIALALQRALDYAVDHYVTAPQAVAFAYR